MSYAMDFPIASEAPLDARAAFIRRTYLHLAGAILAFAGLETLVFKSGLDVPVMRALFNSSASFFVVMIAFIGAGWLAQWWAQSATSSALQYAGLGLYILVETVIFIPLLSIAVHYTSDTTILPKAAVLSLGIFGGLTAAGLISRKDYSFMGPALSIGSFVMIAFAFAGMLFGFNLGLLYCFGAVALACGYIIYDTSNMIHRYRVDQHVGAALNLFADVALLFYYILRILLATSSRD